MPGIDAESTDPGQPELKARVNSNIEEQTSQPATSTRNNLGDPDSGRGYGHDPGSARWALCSCGRGNPPGEEFSFRRCSGVGPRWLHVGSPVADFRTVSMKEDVRRGIIEEWWWLGAALTRAGC